MADDIYFHAPDYVFDEVARMIIFDDGPPVVLDDEPGNFENDDEIEPNFQAEGEAA